MFQVRFKPLCVAALTLLLAVGNANATSKANASEQLTDNIASLSQDFGKKGYSGSLLLAHEGKVLLVDEFGSLAPGNSTQIGTDTVLDTGSLTKQFTGAAILKLVENQQLALDDRLQTYFPQIPADKADISIHQLLTHSSGLQRYPRKGDFDLIETQAYFDKIFSQPLHFTPGSKHRYSNVGYSVLSRIIELVTGQDYETYMQQTLFKPLAMFNTGYLLPNWHKGLVAQTHNNKGKFGSSIKRYLDMGEISWVLKGNGGIHSTLTDMHIWMKALRSGEILSPASVELLTSRHMAEDESGESYYGYGWAVFESKRETKLVAHNGSNGRFFADVIWLQDEDAWVIFMGNTFSEQLMAIAWRAERHLADYLNGK